MRSREEIAGSTRQRQVRQKSLSTDQFLFDDFDLDKHRLTAKGRGQCSTTQNLRASIEESDESTEQ